jgi:hypothetical protein
MITPCTRNLKTFYPRLLIEWVNLGLAKGKTAMSSNDYCHILVDSCCMTFSWFRFPPLNIIISADHSILEVFLDSFSGRFFNNFTYLCIECWQSLFFIIIDVKDLLISQGFSNIVIELNLSNTVHLSLYSLELLFVFA